MYYTLSKQQKKFSPTSNKFTQEQKSKLVTWFRTFVPDLDRVPMRSRSGTLPGQITGATVVPQTHNNCEITLTSLPWNHTNCYNDLPTALIVNLHVASFPDESSNTYSTSNGGELTFTKVGDLAPDTDTNNAGVASNAWGRSHSIKA